MQRAVKNWLQWSLKYEQQKEETNSTYTTKLWLLGDSIHESSTIEPKFNEINFHLVIMKIYIRMLYVKLRKT